jgi:glutamate--cysteine ligase
MLEAWSEWKDRAFVIKPNTTNFGRAVAMFPEGAHRTVFDRAVRNAFAIDRQALLETLIPGKELRSLVIGDFVRAVLHRVPANVRGDGAATIRALVEVVDARGRPHIKVKPTLAQMRQSLWRFYRRPSEASGQQ